MSRKPGTAQLYRRILATVRTHAGPLLVVAVVVFVPLSLLEALGDRALELDLEDLTAFEAGALSVAWLFQVASSLVGEVFYAGAVAALLVGERTGVERRLRDVARELPYVRLVSVDLLYSLGVAVFFILLIVPGVLFFTYYALTAPVVEIEERGIRAAFRRSRELVRGSFWTVLAILLPITVVHRAACPSGPGGDQRAARSLPARGLARRDDREHPRDSAVRGRGGRPHDRADRGEGRSSRGALTCVAVTRSGPIPGSPCGVPRATCRCRRPRPR